LCFSPFGLSYPQIAPFEGGLLPVSCFVLREAEMSVWDFEAEAEPELGSIDRIEEIATQNHWLCERTGHNEVSLQVEGGWASYHISISWIAEIEALHFACAFDLNVPVGKRAELGRLLGLVNEQLWMGHFDYMPSDAMLVFRYALLLPDDQAASDGQIEAMFSHAIEACERYYQAFQFVVWAGRNAKEALATALFETAGEA
jgi:hypothetical protein